MKHTAGTGIFQAVKMILPDFSGVGIVSSPGIPELIEPDQAAEDFLAARFEFK